MGPILKMAIIRTIADVVELLAQLQPSATEEQRARIDELAMRLANVAKSL